VYAHSLGRRVTELDLHRPERRPRRALPLRTEQVFDVASQAPALRLEGPFARQRVLAQELAVGAGDELVGEALPVRQRPLFPAEGRAVGAEEGLHDAVDERAVVERADLARRR